MKGMSRSKMVVSVAAALALVCVSALPALAANKLIVKDSTGTNDVFVVADTAKVGIGTNAPLSAFHISGATLNASQLISQYVGTNTSGGGGFLVMHNNAGGAAPNSGDRLGYFLFGSYINGVQLNAAGLAARAEGAWSSTSTPAYLTFETSPANSVPSRLERMRVTSAGNVGIGTTTPAQKLDVSGGIRLNSTGTQPTCNAANRGTFWLVQGTTDVLQICVQVGGAPTWKTVTLQ